MIFFIVFIGGQELFSYLKISHQGLEYRLWPNYRIRCRWKDVDRIDKGKIYGIFPADFIYLKDAEETRHLLFGGMVRNFIYPPHTIPIYEMKGWPDGKLAQTLQSYVPHLFPENKQQIAIYKESLRSND